MVRAEVIDTHVHLWDLSRPEGIYWIKEDDKVLRRSYTPADFEKLAKENGVGGVVVVQAGQSLPDNQWNLDVTAKNRSLFRGVVGNLSEVIGSDEFRPLFDKLCEDPRYVGYRLSGRLREDLDEAFYRDLKLTAERGRTVDFLVGKYDLEDVKEIATAVPELKIIIDHFGNVVLDGEPLDPAWVAEFRKVAKCPNVRCKVSALYGRFQSPPAPKVLSAYREILDLAWDCFGEDRLIYGSDWPVTRRTGDYASVLDLTRSYFRDKGDGVLAKVMGSNAAGFYGVPLLGEDSK
ncbi:amidohydrolase [Haloferula helveola]|uniref:Amidohydrolase n=2 Tax=Haloferula helveola TaxID=490095 RepID=A0ABM7RAB6_9BACT|nr:amidohydrolase [Haloferula helveola]